MDDRYRDTQSCFFPLCFFPFGYIFLFALRRNNKNVLPTLHTSATSHQVLHNIWEGFWSRNLLREQRVQKKHKKKRRNPNLMKVVTAAVCLNRPMLMLMFQAANKLCHLHSILSKLQVASTTRFTWIPHVLYIYIICDYKIIWYMCISYFLSSSSSSSSSSSVKLCQLFLISYGLPWVSFQIHSPSLVAVCIRNT